MLDPRLRDSLSRSANAVEETANGIEIPASRALTASERTLLMVRRERLSVALRPSDTTSIARRVAKLFSLTAGAAADEEASASLVDDYARLLASQPLWAIDAACLQVLHSGATFRPAAPELLTMARKAADPFRIEAAQIERASTARIYSDRTPEERERVKLLFADFSRKLAPEPVPVPTPESALENVTRLSEASAAAPARASEALLASLGYPRSAPDETAASEPPTAGDDGF